MKRHPLIAALAAALQFAPLGAFASDGETLLNYADLNASVKNLQVEAQGNQVRLFGKVFSDCADKLGIQTQSAAPRGILALEVIDKGGFKACQAGHGSASCTASPGQANTCISLSSLDSSRITVPNQDIQIKIHSVNADADRDSEVYEDLGRSIAFRSSATVLAEARAAQEQRRAAAIEGYRAQVRSCRRNSEELTLARGALSWLASNNIESQAQVSRIRKELDKKELDLLKARVRRATSDELSEIEESVVAVAEANCDVSDAAALTMREIALRYVNARDAGLDGYDRARETLNRTAELGCLSEANQERVASYLRDLEVGRCNKIAESGLSNNFLLGPCVANLMNNLQNQTMRSCNGSNASLEGCSQAMTAMRSAQQIPQRAQQVEQQRAQLMQQIQQTLAGPASAPGMLPNSTPVAPTGFGGPQFSSIGQGTPLWAGGAFGLH